MQHTRSFFITVISILALAGAGCYQTQSTPQTPSSTVQNQAKSPSTTSTSATPAAKKPFYVQPKTTTTPVPTAHTVVVEILHGAFSPMIIAANAGDTVIWQNKDNIPHTTHSNGSLLWDTGSIAPGASASHKFMSPGSYSYSDAVTNMQGTVVIH